jgi:hypothetical protein
LAPYRNLVDAVADSVSHQLPTTFRFCRLTLFAGGLICRSFANNRAVDRAATRNTALIVVGFASLSTGRANTRAERTHDLMAMADGRIKPKKRNAASFSGRLRQRVRREHL